MSSRNTLLHPEKSTYFWWYVLGAILTPFLGIGIILIYTKYKELSTITYKISDREIEAVTPKYSEKTDLANIKNAEVSQSWIDKRFSIGTIQLKTQSKTTELTGIRNPHQIAEMFLQAAEAERQRIQKAKKTNQPDKEPQTAGSIDRLEYLTGLWQQGLMTNEEFKAEKKRMGI